MNKQINIYEEASCCLLCKDAPCTKACKTGDPARAIRAIRFDNHKPALRWVKDCSDDDLKRAEEACIHYNWPSVASANSIRLWVNRCHRLRILTTWIATRLYIRRLTATSVSVAAAVTCRAWTAVTRPSTSTCPLASPVSSAPSVWTSISADWSAPRRHRRYQANQHEIGYI